jgi:hypothetical protein
MNPEAVLDVASTPRMKSIFFDASRQEEVFKNGYTAVRLLSAEEASALAESIVQLRHEGDFATRNQRGMSFHASLLDSDLEYKRRVSALVAEWFAPRIAAILDGYRITTSGVLAKPPGGGELGVHRDWTMTSSVDDICLSVWCPLVDVEESNGVLRFVAGSHRLVRNIEAPHVPFYFQPFIDELKELATPVPVAAGQALIFDTTIVHWSGTNTTGTLRPVAAALCVPQDARMVFHRLDHASGGARFEQLDMEGDAYLDYDAKGFYGGSIDRPSLGFVKNQNRSVSREEFDVLMASGDAIRRGVYCQ